MEAPIQPITNTCPPKKWWRKLTKTDVGLSNVDNTSDLDKPISIAVQRALDEIGNSFETVEQAISDLDDYVMAVADDLSSLDTELHTTTPYVTTNTEQTISAPKKITANVVLESSGNADKSFKLRTTSNAIPPFIDAENSTNRMRQYMLSDGSYAFQAYTDNVYAGEPLIIGKDRVLLTVPTDNVSVSAVNKDWIWQTGANADNGLIHRSGDEWKQGDLGFITPGGSRVGYLRPLDTGSDMRFHIESKNGRVNRQARLELIMQDNNTAVLRLQIRTLDDQYVTYTDIATISG